MICVRSFVEAICNTNNSSTSEHNNVSVSGIRVSGDGGGGGRGGGIDPTFALWPVVLLEDSISHAFTSALRHLTSSWQRGSSSDLPSHLPLMSGCNGTGASTHPYTSSHHHCHSETPSISELTNNIKHTLSKSQCSTGSVTSGASNVPTHTSTICKLTEYSLEQVAEHSTPSDCWIVIYDKIYDITHFLQDHPGGEFILLEFAGRDATLAFRGTRHGPDSYELLKKFLIGILPQSQRIYEKKSTGSSSSISSSSSSSLNLMMSSEETEPNPSC